MIYYAPEIPYDMIEDLPNAPRPRGNQGKYKKQKKYKAVICAFDIETTAIRKIKQSVMYVWQFQIGTEITIVGRTWEQFLEMTENIQQILKDTKLLTFVHNLSYEFCWLAGIWHFSPDDVFCPEPRSILYCDMGPYEFRCSYRLSNMSLQEFTTQMKAPHRKLSGEKFDYSIKRYSWTPLTEDELRYATYDVIGLVESVNQLMINNNDTIYTLPLTSTGFIRRMNKKAMRTFNWATMQRILPSLPLHKYLRKSFRGGNTHADRHYVGQKLHDIWSADIASSYPSEILLGEVPMGRWFEPKPEDLTWDYIKDLYIRRHKALILEVDFLGIRLRDPRWPVPYLAYDKCENVSLYTKSDYGRSGRLKDFKMSADNGRIMAAKCLTTVINDIDLRIIAEEYIWDAIRIKYCAFSSYGKLPQQIREVVMELYRNKCSLKGIPEKEWLYNQSKAFINSVYGCFVQDVLMTKYNYTVDDPDPETGAPYRVDESKTDEQIYESQTHYAWRSYAWGCFITAAARYKLERAIRAIYEQGEKEKAETGRVKTHFVYCDTDSVKWYGKKDLLSDINAEYKEKAEKAGAYAEDSKGKIHYIGVFENETENGAYPAFLTWGAKKYVYRTVDGSEILNGLEPDQEGKIYTDAKMKYTVLGTGDTWHITIAGVGKKKGARELERSGGLDALLPDQYGRPCYTFYDAGGTEAIYNDYPTISEYKIGKHTVSIIPNVYLEQHPYTLSITEQFEKIVMHPDEWRKLIDSQKMV